MSFVLRQVTRRAGGGDIIRLRNIASAEPVIGRGSDCDIQLPDLAVGLRHALLREAGNGYVDVEALGKPTFEANGAFVSKARLDVADGPQVVFGNYVLTLNAGEQPSEIVVTVAQNESAAGAALLLDKNEVFSPRAALFNPRRLAWAAGLGIIAICLALPVTEFFLARDDSRTIIAALGTDRQWSSGPLMADHRFLETDCQSCHQQAFVAVRDEACLTCHKAGLDAVAATRVALDVRAAGSEVAPHPAGDHAAPDRLLASIPPDPNLRRRIEAWFERTFNHPNNRCVSCHIEHVEPASGNAPIAPVATAPGALPSTRPSLSSQLAMRETCEACHAVLNERLPDTKLLNTPNWDKHPDFRILVTLSAAGPTPRLEPFPIATHPPENTGINFSHQDHLLETGGVARMAQGLGRAKGYGAALTCANCHQPEGNGFKPIEMTRDCASCHSLTYATRGGVPQTLPHGKPDEVMAALRALYAAGNSAGPDMSGAFIWRPGFGPLGSANPQNLPQAPTGLRTANGIRAAFARGGTCYGCHTILPPKNLVSLAFEIAPVHLPRTYLPLGDFDHSVKEHREKADGQALCADCHDAAKSDRADDLLMPRITDCASCHGKTKPEVAAAASAACTECHGFHNPTKPGLFPAQAQLANAPP